MTVLSLKPTARQAASFGQLFTAFCVNFPIKTSRTLCLAAQFIEE
jgi:hypothetical protein